MKKGSMIVIIIVFLFSIFMGYRYFEDKKETTSKDAVTFKKEYEALNNRVNPNNLYSLSFYRYYRDFE